MKVKLVSMFVLIAAMLFGKISVITAAAAAAGFDSELRRSDSASDLVKSIWEQNKVKQSLLRSELEADKSFRRGDIFGGVFLQTASMIEKEKRQRRFREAMKKAEFDYQLADEDSELITAGYPVPLKLAISGR